MAFKPMNGQHSRSRRNRAIRVATDLVLVVLMAGALSVVRAQTPALDGSAGGVNFSSTNESALLESTRQWLDKTVSASQANSTIASVNANANTSPLRMTVKLGALDSRLRLAACNRVEPFLPTGSRLWGRTQIGLRCTDGAVRWSVFVPVTVKAFAPAWVLKNDVAAGTILSRRDMLQTEVDWAEDAQAIVIDPALWEGQVASRALTTGQALRQGMYKAVQVFQAGAQIRVVTQGPGFQVASDAQALAAGQVGQSIRVKMDNGRVLSGVVQDARTVKLDL